MVLVSSYLVVDSACKKPGLCNSGKFQAGCPSLGPDTFSITDHVFVADFTVAKHLTYHVILGVEWWCEHKITPIIKDNLLRISHPARILLEVPMIPSGKEAPNILVLYSVTATYSMSFGVLPMCLSNLHAAFDSKLADGLPAHYQFDFEFKLTVHFVKVASLIYPLNLKEEQCLK
ncbi:hypothetical protein DSO57_1004892 [Entomophthora muscae]|uniref:Uncharacterized protein n=1 Tax=Entomophthora muscae TaxID=34485 RepID=A0ACC2TVB6_9FUNG|nr:hypothetical protein DSO57_1004892 [Entomophthora muscae]